MNGLMRLNKMIEPLLQFLCQIRVLHWQSTNYNHHQIYGSLYESLDSSVDKLLETSFGQGFETSLQGGQIELIDGALMNVQQFLNDLVEYLISVKTEIPSETNIIDEMIDEIHKSSYLLKMN